MSDHHEPAEARLDLGERIEWLERELEREREKARQTSKLVLFAMNYADSIRLRVRGEAELTLRKARERAAKILGDVETERKRAQTELGQLEVELRRTEIELSNSRIELGRLQALTHETRTRLSAFTTAALQVLEAEVETEARVGTEHRPTASEQAHSDLRDALQTRLIPASEPSPSPVPLPSAGGANLYKAQEDWNGSPLSDQGAGD